MPVDYSKWDALELSDDSDIEVHPNVDKRSFIRAKQAQIHADRDMKKHQIATLKYERIINDQMVKRISALLECLKSHAEEAKAGKLGEVAFRAVFESAPKNPDEDKPPPRPEGVHTEQKEPLPSYTKMMGTLLDQVNEALNEKKPENRYEAMVDEIGVHLSKVNGLQKELLAKLAELEKEDKGKITSEDIHIGFDSSQVAKSKPADKAEKQMRTSGELLNPDYTAPKNGKTTADTEDDWSQLKASPTAKQFAAIDPDDHKASLDFLSRHSEILVAEETEALLVMALDAELEKKSTLARNCVHQALMLQYCRNLGPDGVSVFFHRITSASKARGFFLSDVKATHSDIKSKAAEILAQSAQEGGGVEQLQLQAVQPGTAINIKVPAAGSDDDEEQKAREVFDTFSPEMRKALESGELDKVNSVLGSMKMEEAEDLLGKISEADILSVEEGIIDATTEEGKKQVEELRDERAREAAAEAEAEKVAGMYSADPE